MARSQRLFALLEALQSAPSATGPELAVRLGVDVRTVRRDIVALHDLGIPVDAARGAGGGYRLRPGYRMPPLMLTPEEGALVAAGLLLARREGLDAETALAKLRRALPDATRAGVEALEATLAFTSAPADVQPPEARTLLVLAEAALRGRRVAGTYTSGDGTTAARELSPHGLVAHRGRWYAPAHDHLRGEERAFRVDRLRDARLLPGRAAPAPDGLDPAAFVARTLARVPWEHAVDVVLHLPPERARERFPPALAELEPEPDAAGTRTRLRMRAQSLEWAAALLAGADCAFEVRAPAALRDAVHALGARLLAS